MNSIRLKCKLTPFIHEPKAQIEKFANQIEWVENTLVDPTSSEATVINTDDSQTIVVNKQVETSNEATMLNTDNSQTIVVQK